MDRFDTLAADLLAKHAVCGDINTHDAGDLQAEIAALYRALAPFAEEAKYATHRPDGPGYLRKSDWHRAREVMEPGTNVVDPGAAGGETVELDGIGEIIARRALGE